MARIAKATKADAVKWNRCNDDCGCDVTKRPDARFCGCWMTSKGKCGRDRRTNAQMRAYAVAVAESLTGETMTADGYLTCAITGKSFHITDGQVDKANPALGYAAGNVIMVSLIGNQERGRLQRLGRDMRQAEYYAKDVALYSSHIPILPPTVAYAERARYAGRQIVKGEQFDIDPNFRNVNEGPYGFGKNDFPKA